MAGISVKTRKRLWLRSDDRCAFTDCRQTLLEEIAEGGDTVVGIECHIVAQEDAPERVARSVSSLTEEERTTYAHLIVDRHGYDNLVLMCPRHSTVIDDPAGGWTVAAVVAMKKAHEKAVAERRGQSLSAGEQEVLLYAEIVDGWVDKADLDHWGAWMGGVFSDGHPRMSAESVERLSELRRWMFSRAWPGTNPPIEQAFDNFVHVATDLQLCFDAYPHEVLSTRGRAALTRFYDDPEWMRQFNGRRLGELYEWLSNLLEDLSLELARAANLICEAVRQTLDPRFRLDEGLVTLESGPYEDFRTRLHRPQYRREDGWRPYRGLAEFVRVRETRDECRGSGDAPEELRNLPL